MNKIIYGLIGLALMQTSVNGSVYAQFNNKESGTHTPVDSCADTPVFGGDICYLKHVDELPVFRVSMSNIPQRGCVLVIRNGYNEEIHREYISGKQHHYSKAFRLLSPDDNEYLFTVQTGRAVLIRKCFAINSRVVVNRKVFEIE